MKRKFFVRTLIISLSAMLLFGIASGVLIGVYTQRLLKEDLLRLSDVIKDEAQRPNANLNNLVSFQNTGEQAFRISFIDSAGNIVADSLGESAYDNHLSRPEVQSALAGKPEFCKRYSETFQKRLMYYAVPFTYAASGQTYVLRVAIETSAATNAIVSAVPFLVLIIAALVAALLIVNRRYNNSMLLPLSDIKSRLHAINTGEFKKLSVDRGNEELLPIVNELNEIAENINSLNVVRSEFFANASHELNTPLTYISGYAELMEKGMLTDPAKIAECGKKIREQAAGMSDLITDMLKLSRLENSPLDSTLEQVNLAGLINSVVDTLRLAADEKRVTISVYCYEQSVVSNEKLLKDILVNLIENAVKYNRPGGRVEVMTRLARGNLEISVLDDGIGIAKPDQTRVFERFYRVDKGRSRLSGGTGLGLAIVKHSVQKLGGSLDLESAPDKGSKFTVTVPLTK
ncbi:MAG: hypothetical protein LBP26_04855 [Clostridiales bacterium]|jgi:two-component system phosphate regulon sensor histidine kinase PhoR|nr:hypothetical protein [Clostridiales bacterium]